MTDRKQQQPRSLAQKIVYGGFIALFPFAVWNALGHFVLPTDVNEALLRFFCGQTAVEQGVRLRHHAFSWYWLHLAPSFFWVAAAPIQFNASVRRKRPVFHRWTGRVFAVCGVVITVTGAYLAWVAPMQLIPSWLEPFVVTIGATISLVSLCVAVVSARRRDFAVHRRSMIRHVATGYIIVLVHVMSLPWRMISGRTLSTEFVSIIVSSFLMIAIATEWWLHVEKSASQRRVRADVKTPSRDALVDAVH